MSVKSGMSQHSRLGRAVWMVRIQQIAGNLLQGDQRAFGSGYSHRGLRAATIRLARLNLF
jgi:hypothetical protein